MNMRNYSAQYGNCSPSLHLKSQSAVVFKRVFKLFAGLRTHKHNDPDFSEIFILGNNRRITNDEKKSKIIAMNILICDQSSEG